MRSVREMVKYSPLSRWATLPMRVALAAPVVVRTADRALRWIFGSREFSDFSYDIDAAGVLSTSAAVGAITGVAPVTVRDYAAELLDDVDFRAGYKRRVASTRLKYTVDPDLRYSKSLVFYLIVRSLRPRLVVEAGTLNGLGSATICRALQRNAQAGWAGRLITVDSRSDRGEFLDGDEGGLVARCIGDSTRILCSIEEPIDLFIHDTTDDADHCAAQFDAVAPRLADGAVMLTSWFNEQFVEFCEHQGMVFLEIADRPHGHWYAGSRFGIARRQAGSVSAATKRVAAS